MVEIEAESSLKFIKKGTNFIYDELVSDAWPMASALNKQMISGV